MKIFGNTGGVFATNSYLAVDEDSKQAVLFDAPNDTTAPLLKFAVENNYNLIGLWLTHGHIDHIADHAVVTSHFPNAKLLIHSLDGQKLQNPNSMYPLPFQTAGRRADELIVEGQILTIGQHQVHVVHTPGHSPGHVAFYIPGDETLIGGDLILMGAVGRTDFKDSSFTALEASLRRVMTLPPDTRLLPGHGHPSSLQEEARSNAYVRKAMEAGPT